MIKFQHIHSADQWEWKVTKGASAGDVGLLETMRADYFGNRLTYACVNQSEFVCITTVAEDGMIPAGTIIGVKGSLSELPEKPCRYAEGWREDDLRTFSGTPTAALPTPCTEETAEAPAMLGSIVDAILKGSRPVVVLTANEAEAVAYMQSIGRVLPKTYADRLGFSMGATKIPASVGVGNVRVFFASPDSVKVDPQNAFVFDLSALDGAVASSEFSRVIDELCSTKEMLDELAVLIAPAFDGVGGVSLDVLEGLSLLFRARHKTEPVAQETVSVEDTGDRADEVDDGPKEIFVTFPTVPSEDDEETEEKTDAEDEVAESTLDEIFGAPKDEDEGVESSEEEQSDGWSEIFTAPAQPSSEVSPGFPAWEEDVADEDEPSESLFLEQPRMKEKKKKEKKPKTEKTAPAEPKTAQKGGATSYLLAAALGVAALGLMFLMMLLFNALLMKGHSRFLSRFMIFPVISGAAAVLFYVFNKEMTPKQRVMIAAIEAAVLIFAMLLAYYGSLLLLGLFL